MVAFSEMDEKVTIFDQLAAEGGPVVLINTFVVPPEDADALVDAWANDAKWMKQQPSFISTQLHRGIAGSGVFLNYAVWESPGHFRAAFTHPEFRARLSQYPSTARASPHLFRKVAVPEICVA
jgi:heme-degrading monooxygenase HmoA